MSTAKRLTERVSAPFAGCRVNRELGTIDGVLLCGTKSANGRDYPAEVLRRDAHKYEGRPVNCDHAREATVDRRFGWFTGVAPGSDGRPRGRLNCLKSHPMYERVMEAAERNPALFGFSHVAMCRTKPGASGREVVEAIDTVESIDLVAEPATTTSLFEGRKMGLTVKALCEALVKHPKVTAAKCVRLKTLAEMDGMDSAPTMMDAPPADDMSEPDTDDAVMSAFKAAISAVVEKAMSGDMDPKAALGKIKTLLTSHAGMNDDGSPDKDADPETPESRRPTGNAILEAIDACATAGFEGYTRDDLENIAEVRPERRAKLIERLKGTAPQATTVTATGKSRIDPSLTAVKTTKTTEAKAPGDAKAFAKRITE